MWIYKNKFYLCLSNDLQFNGYTTTKHYFHHPIRQISISSAILSYFKALKMLQSRTSKFKIQNEMKVYRYWRFGCFPISEFHYFVLVVSVVWICCTQETESWISCFFFSDFILEVNSISGNECCCFVNDCWKKFFPLVPQLLAVSLTVHNSR